MKNLRGFTLVELIVVLVVLSITVTFALPQLSHIIPTGAVQKSGRKLSLFFTQASQLAKEQAGGVRIRYSPVEKIFAVLSEGEGEGDDKVFPEFALDSQVVVRDFQYYYEGVQSTGTLSVLIDHRGYFEPVFIHLQDNSGTELTLQLEPFLGAVNILEGYVNLEEELFIQ